MKFTQKIITGYATRKHNGNQTCLDTLLNLWYMKKITKLADNWHTKTSDNLNAKDSILSSKHIQKIAVRIFTNVKQQYL